MKRVLQILAVIGLVAVLGLTFFRRNNQPSYQGRSLDSWLHDYGNPIGGGLTPFKFGTNRKEFRSAREAIRAMGTNALGLLLAEIKRPDDPAWADATKRFLTKLPWPDIQFRNSRSSRAQAAVAFFDLGTNGIAAIPELTQLLTNNFRAIYASHALAGMGTNAIPAFTTALASSNTLAMDCGAWGLGQIGPESRDTVPLILLQLPKRNNAGQKLMLWALSEIREPVELIRPEFRSRLLDANPEIREIAAWGLFTLGADAKPAEEEIRQALKAETEVATRETLKQLLKVIGAEAASGP